MEFQSISSDNSNRVSCGQFDGDEGRIKDKGERKGYDLHFKVEAMTKERGKDRICILKLRNVHLKVPATGIYSIGLIVITTDLIIRRKETALGI